MTAGQIQQMLGSSVVQDLASKLELSTEDISTKIAEFSPAAIDKLVASG